MLYIFKIIFSIDKKREFVFFGAQSSSNITESRSTKLGSQESR